MPNFEDMILARQEEIELREDCCSLFGDCDECKYRRIVPGTDERIDREPKYYCSLFDEV